MPKIALITGASRGIGLAMARHFAENGYLVYANYNKTVIAPSPNIIPLQGDVTNPGDIASIFAQISKLDVLINNAGIAQIKPFPDITEQDWDNMLTTNLKSAFLVTKAAFPLMLHQKSGSIINISSVWGVTGASCESHYSASKAGLIGLTMSLAKEFGPSGIRVNCIAPGAVDTEMLDDLSASDLDELKSQTPLSAIATPHDIAQAALFLAKNSAMTGTTLNINCGFHI